MKNINLQKGFVSNSIMGAISILLILGVIGYFATKNFSKDEVKPADDVKPMMVKDEVAKPEGGSAMMEKESVIEKGEREMMMKYRGAVLAGKKAMLLDFNKADYDTALKSDKLVVLYFYADWCPLCKDEVANSLYPAFNELADDRTVGFRVNYKDSGTDLVETALAKEFGIGYQHTKVFLKKGVRVLKSVESWDKARYLTEINKAK